MRQGQCRATAHRDLGNADICVSFASSSFQGETIRGRAAGGKRLAKLSPSTQTSISVVHATNLISILVIAFFVDQYTVHQWFLEQCSILRSQSVISNGDKVWEKIDRGQNHGSHRNNYPNEKCQVALACVL